MRRCFKIIHGTELFGIQAVDHMHLIILQQMVLDFTFACGWLSDHTAR